MNACRLGHHMDSENPSIGLVFGYELGTVMNKLVGVIDFENNVRTVGTRRSLSGRN